MPLTGLSGGSVPVGWGSPATVWHRLTEWAQRWGSDQLHLEALERLGEQGVVEWKCAGVDTRLESSAAWDGIGGRWSGRCRG
jgi:hypothetical protein